MPKQPPESCAKDKQSHFPLTWELYESVAWKELTLAEQIVFQYIYSRVTWYKRKGKKLKSANYQATINGEISIASTTLMRDTKIASKQTISSAIAKLVKVGFIKRQTNTLLHLVHTLLMLMII